MIEFKRLVLLLTLGLALALAGCGGSDDGGDGNNGGDNGCPGSNATLAGSCLEDDGTCTEIRGNTGGADPGPDCESDGDTWNAGDPCPAASKTSGGCVIGMAGVYAVGFEPGETAADFQRGCEATGFGCYLAP